MPHPPVPIQPLWTVSEASLEAGQETASQRQLSLDDRYLQEEGTVLLTGIQALARLPMDQHRADKRKGLRTATLVSGYRGSPLGGLDQTLQRIPHLLAAHHITFMPAVNEDLAATLVAGSQLANSMPAARYDGVLGLWYGKAPGLDRSGDALRHGNFAGVGHNGGVLVAAGDDPGAKSSTVPSQSEPAFYDLQMPILYPGNVQEILDLGYLGFELSRYSGCWVGFKIATDVADSFATVQVSPHRHSVIHPGFSYQGKPWHPTYNAKLLPPTCLDLEKEICLGRLEAARRFAAANHLNHISVAKPDDWIGIVAAGKTYHDLRAALRRLGLDDEQLQHHGIRLLKIGMVYPLEPEIIKTFAQGLEEIFVIEEKRSFLELFIRELLFARTERSQVVGKRDELGNPLVPDHGELDVDQIAALVSSRLARRVSLESFAVTEQKPQQPSSAITIPLSGSLVPARMPYFCSGCPHNRSTRTPADSLVGAGIGCHGMVLWMAPQNVTGLTHMGGEGAQWVGAAPFTETPHYFQNIGDGTLFHSGTLAIRQAIAAKVNITYKILYNSAVALTGGQSADGRLSVPALTRLLESEGVQRTIVVSNDPEQYPPDSLWARDIKIWPRDRLDEAQSILRQTQGVTALIYDQECAANLRRKRTRGQVADPQLRVVINEAVCEGCGDCGKKSNCLSVVPVDTEFGRKTQIHQSSCSHDYSCLDGDCPAFITVLPVDEQPASSKNDQATATGNLRLLQQRIAQKLPEPLPAPANTNIYMIGIGGTGVVTANQILGTAAALDGKSVHGLDQTGISQKGGPVVSHLKIRAAAEDGSGRIAAGEADGYLVFDLLSGITERNLSRASSRTVAVVSTSKIATGSMVRSPEVQYPDGERLRQKIAERTQSDQNIYLDANALAEGLFSSHMQANLIVIGAAYQAGILPIRAGAIEQAITLNGAAIETNLQAFQAGRLTVADPEWVMSLDLGRTGELPPAPEVTPQGQRLLDQVNAQGELNRLLAIRIPELIAYQDEPYAQAYATFVRHVSEIERQKIGAHSRLSEAVARSLFKLMAYKDEYEVARLHLKPEMTQALARQFGEHARIRFQLHPPLMRRLGMQKKIGFGRWFVPVLRLLAWMKWTRGTALDIFGHTLMRRTERALIGEYRDVMEKALNQLEPVTYERVIELAALPDIIRGYEEIKWTNIAHYRAKVQEYLNDLAVQSAKLEKMDEG